jgi:RecG-like helicase
MCSVCLLLCIEKEKKILLPRTKMKRKKKQGLKKSVKDQRGRGKGEVCFVCKQELKMARMKHFCLLYFL